MKRLFPLLALLFCFSCSHSRIPERIDENEIAMASPSKMTRRPKIVIDAGHGGKDVGAQSKTQPNHQEKILNLTLALMVDSYLQQMGYQTILTRGDDDFIPLSLRAKFANGNQANLFVSVHLNAAKSPTAQGVEVYYYPAEEDKARANNSKKLAAIVLNQIVANTEAKSRGVKEGDFAVIRETTMPAILVEGGFVTNAQDLAKLVNPDYQRKLANGIALGIHKYFNQ